AAGVATAIRRAASAARVATGQVIPAYPRLRTPYNALIHGTTAATILRGSMRRLVWLTVLAIALAVPAVGYAVEGGSPDDGTLSVKAGAGRIYLNITGTVVGRLYRGSIQVVDPNLADGQGADFFGCDNSGPVDKTAWTSLCRSDGKDGVVRFRAIG